MSFQHKELASGRWNELSLVEQMANVGSEVERALRWRAKNNPEYCMSAFDRALELLDMTLDSCKKMAHLKEVARTREVLVDFFFGSNQFASSGDSLSEYFLQFAFAARKDR
jgi:hypothetical protein